MDKIHSKLLANIYKAVKIINRVKMNSTEGIVCLSENVGELLQQIKLNMVFLMSHKSIIKQLTMINDIVKIKV